MKINNKDEAIKFAEKYATPQRNKLGQTAEGWNTINWERVAREYDGIEFNNQHEYRMLETSDSSGNFFYSLDVDGGCIWDTSIITNQSVYAQRKEEPTPEQYDEAEGASYDSKEIERIMGKDDWILPWRKI